jgi:hypothetical protein
LSFSAHVFVPNSLVLSAVTNAIEFCDAVITKDSYSLRFSSLLLESSNLVAPSRLTQAEASRPSAGFLMVILEHSGRMRGRKEREWGAIGVSRMAGTLECTIEPPAAMLYAVDPEGVEIIKL